jgi:penicillin-binding protein 2
VKRRKKQGKSWGPLEIGRSRGVRRRIRHGSAGFVPPPRFSSSRPLVEPVSTVEEGYFASFAFYRRLGVVAAVAILAFTLLALRAWSLELLHSTDYLKQSQAQQVRIVNLPAPRGAIVDDKLRPLATAGAQLAVVADASSLGGAPFDSSWKPVAHGRQTLIAVSKLTSIPTATLIERIRRSLVQSPFGPAVIVPHASRALTFFMDERASAFPGLHVVELPTRSYPQGSLGGEYLGLLGQVSQDELKTSAYKHAKAGMVVGQSGVEATYDKYMNAGFAHARVRVNALGQIASPLRAEPVKKAPAILQLTIDARIQRAAEKAVQDGVAFAHQAGYTQASSGAAVVIDPRNGAIKALASYPSVNQLRAAQDPVYLQNLLTGKAPGLLNLATQGLYPAGSTFKPIVAEAALASGLITPSTYLACTGSLTVGNIIFHNVEPSINQTMNLEQALEMSCDTWFYRLGEQFYFKQERGSLALQQWASWLGLGHPTGIDIPGEAGGVVPTPAWLKRQFGTGPQGYWYEGTSVNLSIGQGFLEVTPLQMAVAYSALANGGDVVQPHLAQALLGAHRKLFDFPPVRKLKLRDVWAIRDGLFQAAHGSTGTSTAIFGNFPIPVAGKTGTAQDPHGSDDSWYASWAPSSRPRYVVVVLIPHGGFGANAAAPAAREIYSAIFHVKAP